jgi:hypothetical protein
VVDAGKEGLAAGGEDEPVAGTTGAATLGFVGDEALGFEPLEVLAGGAIAEKSAGGDLFHGRGAEPAEGDEDGAAGRVEEIEAGDRGHGGGSVKLRWRCGKAQTRA